MCAYIYINIYVYKGERRRRTENARESMMCVQIYEYIYVYKGERRRRTENAHAPICPLNNANLACHRNASKIIRGANALCNPLCQKNSTLAMPHRLLMISLATICLSIFCFDMLV